MILLSYYWARACCHLSWFVTPSMLLYCCHPVDMPLIVERVTPKCYQFVQILLSLCWYPSHHGMGDTKMLSIYLYFFVPFPSEKGDTLLLILCVERVTIKLLACSCSAATLLLLSVESIPSMFRARAAREPSIVTSGFCFWWHQPRHTGWMLILPCPT